jgi:hypothetical protein
MLKLSGSVNMQQPRSIYNRFPWLVPTSFGRSPALTEYTHVAHYLPDPHYDVSYRGCTVLFCMLYEKWLGFAIRHM